jgi:sodium-dependent dicarboxylate transporter 2/3/5
VAGGVISSCFFPKSRDGDGVDRALIIACTPGASSACMMPVGTSPNAIVFGTGLVRMPQMMKAGVWLNLAGILVITALCALMI